MLGYSHFLSLISEIDKNTIFDAAHPEIIKFRGIKYPGTDSFEAYREIFKAAYLSTDGLGEFPDYDYENHVANMRKKRKGSDEYRADIRYAHWFYFYSLFSPNCDDPNYGERISHCLFEDSFYNNFETELRDLDIPRPSHLPPLQIVGLGQFNISLGYDVGLTSLSLEENQNNNVQQDGIQGVFNALNWRSKLTNLHGRSEQYNRLIDWAKDKKSNQAKIILVSGPGGSGKSRLVADAVSHLVHQKKWRGGFLPSNITNGEVFDGGGKGVALIVDYPEERFELVKELISAAMGDKEYDHLVRIILVSRENLDVWRKNLNKPYLQGVDEIRLGASPYLNENDAQKIADDVAKTYPDRIGKSKPVFTGVEEWLKQHHSHRLPLITLAASVHAVHEPDKAFTLSGKDVLKALAKIELQRVQNYSLRDLKNREALEILLGLSMFTLNGLSKETVFALGNDELCSGLNGEALLRAVQRTPFWKKKTSKRAGHIIKLEPDRLAAAFLYIALGLEEPSPALSKWMASVVEQGGEEFSEILARVGMDLSHINPVASHNIEKVAIKMIEQTPYLMRKLRKIAYRKSSVFSAKFSIAICKNNLASTIDQEDRASLLNNLCIFLSMLGKYEDAVQFAEETVNVHRQRLNVEPEAVLPQLATSLNTFAVTLSRLGMRKEAQQITKEATDIFRQLAIASPEAYLPELAQILNNLANKLADRGQFVDALKSAEEAEHIRRQLPNVFLPDLAQSQHTLAIMLHQLGRQKDALHYAEEAVNIYRQQADVQPEVYLSDLAGSLNNLTILLSDIGLQKEALQCATEAVSHYRELTKARPEVFQANLARSLNTVANRLSYFKRHKEALQCAKDAMNSYRQLAQVNPDSFLPDLARSLNNLAIMLSNLETNECAIKWAKESVSIRRSLVTTQPNIFLPDLAISLNTLVKCLSGLRQYGKALQCAEEAIVMMGPFFLRYPSRFKVWVVSMVDDYLSLSNRLGSEPNLVLLEPIVDMLVENRDGI